MAARCGECGIVLPFEHSNPEDLMLHTQTCHPGIKAVRYDLEGDEEASHGGVIVDEDGIILDEDGQLIDDDDDDDVASADTTCTCSSGREFGILPQPKNKIYRTKIEAWRPGLGYMYCPFCNDKTNPLIQQNKTKVSDGSLRTTFWMFACWPLCFLPIATHQPVYLYCSMCREYLGAYDRENMRVVLRKKKGDPCPKKAKRTH